MRNCIERGHAVQRHLWNTPAASKRKNLSYGRREISLTRTAHLRGMACIFIAYWWRVPQV